MGTKNNLGVNFLLMVDVEMINDLEGLAKLVSDSFIENDFKSVTLTGNLSSELIGYVRENCIDKVKVDYFPINFKLSSEYRRINGHEIDLDNYLAFR